VAGGSLHSYLVSMSPGWDWRRREATRTHCADLESSAKDSATQLLEGSSAIGGEAWQCLQ
jgi:hypothetical protein